MVRYNPVLPKPPIRITNPSDQFATIISIYALATTTAGTGDYAFTSIWSKTIDQLLDHETQNIEQDHHDCLKSR